MRQNVRTFFSKLLFSKSPWDQDDNVENIFTRKRNNQPFFNGFNFNMFDPKNKKFIVFSLLALVALWLSSGIYKVDEGEEAAVLRFGKFVRLDRPGLNYHLPAPFEKVIIEKVHKSRRTEIGYRSLSARNYNIRRQFDNRTNTNYRYLPEESIMLTGDENLVDLNCDILWRINSIFDYTFNIADQERTVEKAAESAIREVIGKTPISFVLSNKKQEIAEKIEEVAQKMLNDYGSGIKIDSVQLLKAEPPMEVIDAYRDVQTSRADKEKIINEAYAYRNNILPQARGEAAKIIQNAEAYKQEVVANSEGLTNKFNAILSEYRAQKLITRDRLYLDMIEQVLKKANKTIIDQNNTLPHIALGERP